jgi:hypothetical protein
MARKTLPDSSARRPNGASSQAKARLSVRQGDGSIAALALEDNPEDWDTIRTTVPLPAAVHLNLAIWCARKKLRRNEGIVQILVRFLASEGLQPDKTPKGITVSY